MAVGKLRHLVTITDKRFELLRKFLKQNHISKPLRKRVTNFCSMRLADTKSLVDEQDVDLLPLLSKDLHGDLQIAIKHPRIKGYLPVSKFFRTPKGISLARLIATQACNTFRVVKDQEIFQEKEIGRGMYFLCAGVFDLVCADHTRYSISSHEENAHLPKDGVVVKWVSEFSLHTEWLHKDRLVAMFF